jgi:leucyl-tRNA synthetase
MDDRYDPSVIEPKWQRRWEQDDLYRAVDGDTTRPKWYALTMFPYPSGDLHTGHWYAMVPPDVGARYRRMRGYNVMFPMGFDSFGLPAENAAIKNGVDPRIWTYTNIDRMRGQMRRMGASFDWAREVVTSDPDYYRWTQWWFLKLFERGLAYRAEGAANWCPGCQTVLANEQVINGLCERSDDVVERRFMTQWFFRITNYAEELLRFEDIDWPTPIETMQTNWIGRSEGALLHFPVQTVEGDDRITVFTTRPDTVYGATFMVLAPEHPLVGRLTSDRQRETVEEYVARAARTTEIERLSTDRQKTGVDTGGFATNPFTGEQVPVFIADYVLVTYGTGAIMAVPAHDQRDFEFARAYGLDIRPVMASPEVDPDAPLQAAYTSGTVMINSGPLNRVPVSEAVEAAVALATERGLGERKVTYRMRDWLISRQRYWGTPIPIVYCDACGIVPVPEQDLPVLLPENVTFEPTGRSPLADTEDWVNVPCPACSAPARRETDTMDTFMCSSWYQMRYADPHNPERPFSQEAARYWFPVDQYSGGPEHAVMHLLYTRFFWKAARDMGLVTGDEPMTRLLNQGVILGPDGARMSKSRGNVVPPDEQVDQYGVDAFRCHLMFIGPWDQGGPYNPTGMPGIVRWLNRLWTLVTAPVEVVADASSAADLRAATHRTVRTVTEDIEAFRFNTLIARLMEFVSTLARAREAGPVDQSAWSEAIDALLRMLAPLAPHIAEELWECSGHDYSIHRQPWPQFDTVLAMPQTLKLAVQVNGKVRDHIAVQADASEDSVIAAALANDRIAQLLAGRTPKKVIHVAGRLVNVVV